MILLRLPGDIPFMAIQAAIAKLGLELDPVRRDGVLDARRLRQDRFIRNPWEARPRPETSPSGTVATQNQPVGWVSKA